MKAVLCVILIVALWANSKASTAAFLDLEEINLVQYDVKIGDEPIVLNHDDGGNVDNNGVGADVLFMPMTNKYGQKYHCVLPKAKESSEDVAAASDLEAAKMDIELAAKLSGMEKAQKLLEPMSYQPCLLRTKDWWTYEFCFGKSIRRYYSVG